MSAVKGYMRAYRAAATLGGDPAGRTPNRHGRAAKCGQRRSPQKSPHISEFDDDYAATQPRPFERQACTHMCTQACIHLHVHRQFYRAAGLLPYKFTESHGLCLLIGVSNIPERPIEHSIEHFDQVWSRGRRRATGGAAD